MYKVLEGVASNESQFIELSIMFRRIAEKTAGLSTIPSRWTIQNTAKNCGQLEVALPFPNRVGLHSIHFNEATCISDILTTLHQHDSHLKCVDVVTTDGLPMARSMQLKELTCIHQFMIRLNDNHFTIQNGTKTHDLIPLLTDHHSRHIQNVHTGNGSTSKRVWTHPCDYRTRPTIACPCNHHSISIT